eukprot:TRINITY_DN4396_c0_g1_i8.p1 TRINITY_DN4396_c0_g1~~TRINITY_DN4396_c0_g1_i8.p1  ORF type:complete len:237 (+),score=59.07 TRINITY_DN4396_c0_g1_i8:637-1347(+)
MIYLIDFGLAKRYQDSKTGTHIAHKKNKVLTGTARYASMNTHMGYEQSRRDDMESILYSLIYLAKGSLPWQKAFGRTKKERYQQILRYKTSTTVDVLCKDLPGEFKMMMKYVQTLKFTEEPDYDRFLGTFESLLQGGHTPFDWEVLQEESQQNRILAHFMAIRGKQFSDVADVEEPTPKKRLAEIKKKRTVDVRGKTFKQDSIQNNFSTHLRGDENGVKQPQLVGITVKSGCCLVL